MSKASLVRIAEILMGFRHPDNNYIENCKDLNCGDKTLSVEQLKEMLIGYLGPSDGFNFYPGEATDKCHELAIFVALESQKYRDRFPRHMAFGKALEKLVQHTQGHCRKSTGQVLFLTDTWDTDAMHKWAGNLMAIDQSKVELAICLVANDHIQLIDFSPSCLGKK